MKIQVSYSELKSGPGFNNKKAECSIEMEVNGNVDRAFDLAWKRCKREVAIQLGDCRPSYDLSEDIPF